LTLRKKFCQKEVIINKILCLDIYKGVVKIVQENNGSSSIRIRNLHNHNKALKYAVKVTGIPEKFLMYKLIYENKVSAKTMTRLAETPVKFHQSTHQRMPELCSLDNQNL
jgi:aminoglycoside phosphotransferase family enzyme